jgi:hypothetical protein
MDQFRTLQALLVGHGLVERDKVIADDADSLQGVHGGTGSD